jgi:site-specific recombinase XerD
MKINQWARKAGVPHIHTHSLRHYVGTTLFEKGANSKVIQAALGHESLDVTMSYASVTGRDVKQAIVPLLLIP